jgi:Ca2+-binding RTX toxin-like protein
MRANVESPANERTGAVSKLSSLVDRRLKPGVIIMDQTAVRMEAVEGRVLLSASLGADGTLSVAGTRRADAIDVIVPANDPRGIVVTVNGVQSRFRGKTVKRFEIALGLGNDRLQMRGVIGSLGVVDKPTAIDAGGGDDVIDGGNGPSRIDGGPGHDAIDSGDGNDTLSGGDGDDTLLPGLGRNVVSGDAGRDNLVGGTGNDSMSGGAGDDNIIGGGGKDTLQGDNGRDIITNNDLSAAGVVQGGRGDDVIRGSAGVSLFGNAGFDDFTTPATKWAKDAGQGDVIRLS